MHFYLFKDRETPDRAGMGGMFQVAQLEVVETDGTITDVTSMVDQGMFFSDEDYREFVGYLAQMFNRNHSEISFEEV